MAEIVLLAGAERDSLDLYFILHERSATRAERFSAAVDTALGDSTDFPMIGRPFFGSFRRKLVPGFYDYGIFYSLDAGRVMVHAIMDLRQNPAAILRRLMC